MRAELEESIPRPTDIGVSPFELGALVTGTLLVSVAATLAVGLLGHRLSRKRILLGAAVLTVADVVHHRGRPLGVDML